MSAVLVRAALEAAIAAMTPPLATDWENDGYKTAAGTPGSPVPGTPYQEVRLLLAEPDNSAFGSLYTEQGYMQVKLKYPNIGGTGAATARAELIRSTFTRGATFTASGQKVHVTRTPEISPGPSEDDRFVLLVKVRIHAHIGS